MFYPTEFNKPFQVTLGQTLPPSARKAIEKFLVERGVTGVVFPEWWSWRWEVVDREHGYQGSFPKRVSKLCRTLTGKWLAVKDQSDLGELVQRHLKDGGATYWFDFDHKLDWVRGSFGDPTSCFVHPGSGYLKDLREVKAFAFRRWVPAANAKKDEECEEGSDDDGQYEFVQNGYQGRGRTWVVPVAEMLAVINVYDYDGLSLTTYGQALAEHLGQEFHKVTGLIVRHHNFYANNGSGVLIGPSEQVAQLPRDGYNHIQLD